MAKYSNSSKQIIMTCTPRIQVVCFDIIEFFDCKAICGRRGRLEQEKAFANKSSKAHFGESPHNYQESYAIDLIPYPIDWRFEKELFEAIARGDQKEADEILHNIERWSRFIGEVLATGRKHGVELTSGSDWNRDTHMSDNRFDDFPHFEETNWRDLVEVA